MVEGDAFHSLRLSLPPGEAQRLEDHVSAPFAAPLLKNAQIEAQALLFMVDERPFLGRASCLALDPDPLALLALMARLTGPASEAIARAFTRFLDTPYRGRPWGQVIQNLYLTTCPACLRPATARAYHWQGYPPALIARLVRCEQCGFEGEAIAEPEDQARAAEAYPGRALSWQMQARVAPENHALRPRVEQATAFYTPRNLWVLWESLRILEAMDLDVDLRRSLQWLLALVLWSGSNLADQPDVLWQSTLRRPYKFVEYNLWECLHEALDAVRSVSGNLERRMASGPQEALAQGGTTFWLAQRRPQHLQERIPRQALDRILVVAPPALPLYWLLRFVWSGWLFGERAAAQLQDFVDLRAGGGPALTAILAPALAAAMSWLKPEGELALQWRWRGDDDPTAAVLASLPGPLSGLVVAEAGRDEYVARASMFARARGVVGGVDLPAAGREAMLLALRRRGEPMPAGPLRAQVLAAWQAQDAAIAGQEAEAALKALLDPGAPPSGMLALGLSGRPWQTGEPPWWWLQDPPEPWQPASDGAERVLPSVLAQAPAPNPDELAWRLTLALSPDIPPDRPWIDALIASYCRLEDGEFCLRPQDAPPARAREVEELAGRVLAQGRLFGFQVAEWTQDGTWTVEWLRESERFASFLFSASTALTPRLWLSRAPLPGLRRFLALPGGRAALVQRRIDHQPLWAEALAAGGWRLVKFRHLRHMLAEAGPTPERWLDQLSLDPVTASHPEQLRLL